MRALRAMEARGQRGIAICTLCVGVRGTAGPTICVPPIATGMQRGSASTGMASAWRWDSKGRDSAPDFVGDFHRHAQLGPLLLFGEDVALLGAGEAALRTEAELIEGDIFLRLADAAFDVVLILERS